MVKKAVFRLLQLVSRTFEPLFTTQPMIFYHCNYKKQFYHGKNSKPHKIFTIANTRNNFSHGKIRIKQVKNEHK